MSETKWQVGDWVVRDPEVGPEKTWGPVAYRVRALTDYSTNGGIKLLHDPHGHENRKADWFRAATEAEVAAVPFASGDWLMPVCNSWVGTVPAQCKATVGEIRGDAWTGSGWRHATPGEYRKATRPSSIEVTFPVEADIEVTYTVGQDDPLEQSGDDGERALVEAALQKLREDVDVHDNTMMHHVRSLNQMDRRFKGLEDWIRSAEENHADLTGTVVVEVARRLDALEAKPRAVAGVLLRQNCTSNKTPTNVSTFVRLGDEVDENGLGDYTTNLIDAGTQCAKIYRLNPAGLEAVPVVASVPVFTPRTWSQLDMAKNYDRGVQEGWEQKCKSRNHPAFTAACCAGAAVAAWGSTLWALGVVG